MLRTLTLLILSAIVMASVGCDVQTGWNALWEPPVPTQTPTPSEEFKTRLVKSLKGRPEISLAENIRGSIRVRFVATKTSGPERLPCDSERCANPDIWRILWTVDNLYATENYKTVTISATHKSCDDFGHCGQRAWIWASYDKKTIDRINWDNFSSSKVDNIADHFSIYGVSVPR